MVLVVAGALGFAFSNGFHDTFDLISTAVSTGAAPPQVAIAVARCSTSSAPSSRSRWPRRSPATWSKAAEITPGAVLGGLVGAIAWNLWTWHLGLPSSSSHALIGGLVGATSPPAAPTR